jgi:hypothetical protein
LPPVEVVSVAEDPWKLLVYFPVEEPVSDPVSELLLVDEPFFEVLL